MTRGNVTDDVLTSNNVSRGRKKRDLKPSIEDRVLDFSKVIAILTLVFIIGKEALEQLTKIAFSQKVSTIISAVVFSLMVGFLVVSAFLLFRRHQRDKVLEKEKLDAEQFSRDASRENYDALIAPFLSEIGEDSNSQEIQETLSHGINEELDHNEWNAELAYYQERITQCDQFIRIAREEKEHLLNEKKAVLGDPNDAQNKEKERALSSQEEEKSQNVARQHLKRKLEKKIACHDTLLSCLKQRRAQLKDKSLASSPSSQAERTNAQSLASGSGVAPQKA